MANFNIETTEVSKSSFKVEPDPKSYRGGFTSATNPSNVGVATSAKGAVEGK